MHKIINKFLLVGNKFMPEMPLRQTEFTYSACGPLTKNKEWIQKFKKTGDPQYISQNELDKVCFQHGLDYGGFEDSPRRTTADKVLHDKTLNIATNPSYDEYQCTLASVVYKFVDKKSSGSSIKKEIMSN